MRAGLDFCVRKNKRCLPDSPKPDSPKPDSPKLGLGVGVFPIRRNPIRRK